MEQTIYSNLAGIMPAIASPCDESDRFLEDQFAELARHLYKQGVHGLYICGATGDGICMRLPERKRAAEIAVQVSKEFNGTVIAHVGAQSSRDASELAEHAAHVGCHAVSSMAPNNRNLDQLVSYYGSIAEAAQIPVLIYHIPMLTGRASTTDEMLTLLDIDGVVGLKFSEWNLFNMKRLMLARPEVIVFNGMDEFLVPGLLFGAVGGIGSNYNLFPGLFLQMYSATKEGRIDRAMELQNLFLAYADLIWRYGIFQSLTVLMNELGFGPCFFRKPGAVMECEHRKSFLAEVKPRIDAIEAALKLG